jgi:hypothetical protein
MSERLQLGSLFRTRLLFPKALVSPDAVSTRDSSTLNFTHHVFSELEHNHAFMHTCIHAYMHSCINLLSCIVIEGLRQVEFVNIAGMKMTKSYKFKEVDLASSRDLALKIEDPTGFRHRYGALLSILHTNVDEKLVHTLVQFYDPKNRCFTFPDFQLMPTLEAYSHLMDLSIAKGVPFAGLEHPPTSLVIAKDLHLTTSDVSKNLVTNEVGLSM